MRYMPQTTNRPVRRFSVIPLLTFLVLLGALFIASCQGAGAGNANYAHEVWKDKPLGWWRFDDQSSASGAIAMDQMGVHPGTYHGGVALEAEGPPTGSKAATFDGKSYLEIPHHAEFALNTLSVEFWLKSTQAWDQPYWPGSATLVSKATAGVGSGDWTILGGSTTAGRNQGRVVAASGPHDGNRDQLLPSRGGLNDGTWHHVVWTRSDNGVCALYVDGRFAIEANDGGLAITNTRPIQLGGEAMLEGGTHLKGSLAEVAIYSTPLSLTRVQAHYLAAFPDATLPEGKIAGGAPEKPGALITLTNKAGLRWELERRAGGWSLGRVLLHEKPVDRAISQGVLCLHQTDTDEDLWLPAAEAIQVDGGTARLSGQKSVDGAMFHFEVEVSLAEDMPKAALVPRWSVDGNLTGYEVCLAYQGVGTNDWRVQSYPFAGNSEGIAITPMRYCGVPGALIYRPNLSMVVLFAIDTQFDYLNPTTWTGKTGFHFVNRKTAPQFRCGGGKFSAGFQYEHPVQMFFSDSGEFATAISSIMENWIKANHYKVDESLSVRTAQEAFQLTLEGRRKMASWKPGIGYEHHKGTPFVYVGNNPYIAYYEYRLFEITGEKMWRDRAFEQIDFAIKGQQPNGVFHTSWYFRKENRGNGAVAEGFCSWDWNHGGYKVDLNAWMVRYILQTWQRVKEKEGVDRQDWYRAAMASLNWLLAQQNQDGGFPQVVEIDSGRKSESVVCARALAGLPIIGRITGDERCLRASADQERFLRNNVEGRFWYTGAHPDLPPGDFEQDSIYGIVEYWLDKHDRTGNQECLDRAVANACYGLLYWCPKQLSWVKSPTQGAHSEQQHFNQYSVYCYGNRKIQCLDRLFKKTGNRLFEQLRNRVMQLNFYVQVADGPYQGAMTEAIADPWLERGQGFEWRGSPYTSELVADLMLQLIEMELISKTAKTGHSP